MRIVLVVSLALNLLVAGVLLGAWFDRGPHRDSRLREAGPMAPFVAAMDSGNRHALLGDLRGGERSRGSSDFRARFDAMLNAIRVEPFDPMRLEDALAEQRAAAALRQEAGERLLVDRIATMNPAERTAYADRLEAAFARPHGR